MNIWIELITVVAEVILPVYFFHGFFSTMKCGKSSAVLFIFLYGVLLAFASLYLPASLMRTVLIIVITYSLAFFLFRKPWIVTLYPVFLFFFTAIISDVICGAAFTGVGISIEEFMGIGSARAIYNSLAKLVHLLFLYIILRIMRRKYESASLVRCLPLIACILVSFVICFYNFSAWMNSNAPVGAILGSVGLLYINILICIYIDIMDQIYKNQKETELEKQQLEIRAQYYQDMIGRQEETRSLWHDIKKYMSAMEALVGTDNKEEARRCLETISEKLSGLENVVDTGNTLVDSIFNYGFRKAALSDVSIIPKIWVSPDLDIPSADLFIIIGNTLDNAVEACGLLPDTADRTIHISLQQKNHILRYEISNPYIPGAKGKRGKFHGYGLRNVKTLVEKNGGSMSISRDDGFFAILIYLNA